MPYNYNPAPRGGQGPFGQVPGVITPPDPAADLARQFPGLARTNAALSRDIIAGLEGQLRPATIAALQDANAAFGIQSGMPGITPGTFTSNRLGRNIGLKAEDLAQKAIENYNATIPTISKTQTVDPALLYQIALQNSMMGAAPDPGAAARYSESLYNRYLGSMGGGGRMGPSGPGGGTRGVGPGPGVVVGPSMGTETVGGNDFGQSDWWASIGWNPTNTGTPESPYGPVDEGLMNWLDYGVTDLGDQGGGGGYNYFDITSGGTAPDWSFGGNDLTQGYYGGGLDYGGMPGGGTDFGGYTGIDDFYGDYGNF